MPAQGIAGRIPELICRGGVAVSIAHTEQARCRYFLIIRRSASTTLLPDPTLFRSIDVKLFPGAPLCAVESPHPEIIRPRSALERGAGKLCCGHIDVLIGALRHA